MPQATPLLLLLERLTRAVEALAQGRHQQRVPLSCPGSPNPMLRAYRMLYSCASLPTPQLWERQQLASVNQQAV